MAAQAAPRHQAVLWARDEQQALRMQRERSNARYLPGIALPDHLHITADREVALAHARGHLVVVATPMSALRAMLQVVSADTPVLCLCKGLEAGSGLIGHELARQLRPDVAYGVLSGPSFAAEVAGGKPTALVAASHDACVPERAVDAFHAQALRVYTSTDPVGVEVGGAVKNVMAIAAGVCDGLGLGLNARAALITRGLAEITRLGLALGARSDTFMGLSGLGDLVLTATGDLSRNRRLGLALARGRKVADVLAELGQVSEGAYSARTIAQRAQSLGVDMPITEAVVALLEGRLWPAQAVAQLLEREARAEA